MGDWGRSDTGNRQKVLSLLLMLGQEGIYGLLERKNRGADAPSNERGGGY